MKYALIENEAVINVIVIYEGNVYEFPNAVEIGDVSVQIGDTYADGTFYRNGDPLYSPLESANKTISELDEFVVDLTYQNVLLELGI